MAFLAPVHASTVIYYDGDEYGVSQANMLLNLAGHFDEEVVTREVSDYEAQDLDGYDFAFYIGTDWGPPLPAAFLADVTTGQHRVMWISGNLEQLTDPLGDDNPFGFRGRDWNPGEERDQINYKDRFLKRRQDLSFTDVETTGLPVVYSFFTRENSPLFQSPHFLCGGRLCFLAENPFFFEGADDRMWVLADLLHVFYETDTPARKTAMLRFEDLSAGNYVGQALRELADELWARGVPFGLSVIPIFRDPEGIYNPPGTEVRLHEVPDFVETINLMLRQGGTMAMHGTTHQHDDGLTGLDWEFTQGMENDPLGVDSEDWVRAKIEEGLEEFRAVGWEPMIWETPHYAASHGDYLIIAEYFETTWERPLVFPRPPESEPVFGTNLFPFSQRLPYYSLVGALGMGNLPENLGYIDIDLEKNTPEAMLAEARRISIVRDGVASFFFHHTIVEIDHILELVDGLLEQGYTFIGAEDFIGDDGMDGDEDDSSDDDDDDEGCGC